MNKMSDLDKLNSDQREAVESVNGPLLIIAGAGTGKTKTLTSRINHLINETQISPEKILAITFTNKAATEMRQRVLSRQYKSSPFISTFHSLGLFMIKQFNDHFNLKKNFSILDRNDSKKIIKNEMKKLGIDEKEESAGKILGQISSQKSENLNIEEYLTNSKSWNKEKISIIWRAYEKALEEQGCLDFDDLLIKPLNLLESNKEALNFFQDIWSHIHIDEYQDTNEVQYLLAKKLSQKHNNICVVGDLDQNIYSWRGAKIENILSFERDFSGAKTVSLKESYRSSKNILNAADKIISKNKNRLPKEHLTQNQEGEKISFFKAFSENDEAEFVSGKIEELSKQNISLDQIAVLYRANFQSRPLEESLMAKKIPYHVAGVKFFERREIKEITSYLKAALLEDNYIDIARTINSPKRGIGNAGLDKILNQKTDQLKGKALEGYKKYQTILGQIKEASKKDAPSEIIKKILNISGLKTDFLAEGEKGEDRLANVEDLVSWISKYDKDKKPDGLLKFLEDFCLLSDQDSLEKSEPEKIKLLTVHSSKGLEFEYVFITGLEDELFPSGGPEDNTKKDPEEERRLFYVALTRAKKKIFLSSASNRIIFGKNKQQTESEFLTDIPENLIEEDFTNKEVLKTFYLE